MKDVIPDKHPPSLAKAKWTLLLCLAGIFFVAGFFFQSPRDILPGLWKITIDPSLLLSDYIEIGGLGATLWNSAFVILAQVLLMKINNARLTGTLVATVTLVGGFAFFGTNLLNSAPIIFGAWLHAKLDGQDFTAVQLQAFLSTALSPLVSILIFALDIPFFISIPLGILVGTIIGFIVPTLSGASLRYHQGYTLYNIGFLAGVIGMIGIALLRMFGFEVNPVGILHDDHLGNFVILLAGIFVALLITGFVINHNSLHNYKKLLKNSGRLVVDFDLQYGTGLTFFNMGLMGLISIAYVLLVQGPFNGPVIGGIISVAAFAAMGKHPRNSIPVMIGVFLAGLASPTIDHRGTSAIITALFGTTLAPVAGEFGPVAGVVAGFLHMAMVGNVIGAHGGVNLYNNGFSSGFIAATMVPFLQYLRTRKEEKDA